MIIGLNSWLFTRVVGACPRLQTPANPFTLWFDILDHSRMITNSTALVPWSHISLSECSLG